MKNLACFFCFLAGWLLLGISRPASAQQTPPFQWATSGGGSGSDWGVRNAQDTAGNTYAAGFFSGTATFQSASLVSQGGKDVYLAKYAPNGQLLWIRQLAGMGDEQVTNIVVDATGNVVIMGNFSSNSRTATTPLVMTIGSFTLIAGNATEELYLAKYDAQGTALWARQSTSSAGLDAWAVALNPGGDIYLAASLPIHGGTAQLGLQPVYNSFLAKYDGQGTLQWVKQGLGQLTNIAIDSAGYLYLHGFSNSNTLTLGAITLTTSAGDFGYFGRFDATGTAIWAYALTYTSLSFGVTGIAAGANQSLVLTEVFSGTTSHGGQTFTANGYADVLTYCYSAQGTFLWAKQLGSPSAVGGADWIHGPVVDAAGNSYSVVDLPGMPTLTTHSGTAVPYYHLVSYSPMGALRWTRTVPVYVVNIAVSAAGEPTLTGLLDQPSSFDSFRLMSMGGEDMYLAKLAAGPDATIPSVIVPNITPPGFIPNVITPNGDGLNDKFTLSNLPPGPWQLRVYSRWGQEVYRSANYQQDWTAAGLSAGVYYYLLQIPNQASIKGWVEVIR